MGAKEYPRLPETGEGGVTAAGRGAAAAGQAAAAGHGVAREITPALLAWHAIQRRDLAIRRTRDPWPVLVAEVMSQQTQIHRVGAYWEAFVATYPTPAALAAAPLRDVLRAWAGLGYNRRAVALRDAAAAIVARHGGAVPRTVAELDALPGVGPYTARAVAAQAFHAPVAAVDVNVRRVVERLAGARLAPARTQALADALVDPDRPDAWTHAAMDLAATVCRRRSPLCEACPLATWCASAGTAGDDPVKRGPAAPFHATRRWLRGRLLAELTAADTDAWVPTAGPRGIHDDAAVREALAGLVGDGLVEVDGDGRARVR